MNNLELFLKYNLSASGKQQEVQNDKLDYFLYSKEKFSFLLNIQNSINLYLYFSYDDKSFCPYCENNKQYKDDIISEQTIKNLMKKINNNVKNIIILGKDPLILPENLLLTLINEKEKNNLNSLKIDIFTTSASYQPKKEFLKNLNINPIIPFDGIKNTENRNVSDTNFTLSLIDENKNIALKNTFMENNLEENENIFIKNYLYYKTLGLDAINLRLINNFDYSNNLTPIIINNKFIYQFLNYIEYWIYDKDNPILDLSVTNEISRLFGRNAICWNKRHCLNMFCIDPLGNIGFCNCDLINTNFGNINNINNIEDIFENETYKKILKSVEILTARNCINCPWHDSCFGGCLGMNFKKDNSLHSIDRDYCNYTKFILSSIYQLIKNIDIQKDKDKYNPLFIKLLQDNNYYSLDKIFSIEKKYSEEEE